MAQQHIAFVCPRFSEGPTVGGAETLMRYLAEQTAHAGHQVTLLTTCARNHFTWENELPPGKRRFGPLDVHFFEVDTQRDLEAFIRAQQRISRGVRVSHEEEMTWLRHNVNSASLCAHLQENRDRYDRVIAGPYLFGLIYHAARVVPEKTLLVPCLHDEPFAHLKAFREMFSRVRGCLFNSIPERELAQRLFDISGDGQHVVGMGMEPFSADPEACARKLGLEAPYLVYSGRREPLKGTPLMVSYLEAFRSRTGRDIKLVLTGSGPIDRPPGMASHIFDLGFVSEKEKHDAMAGALAFCHPSTNESFGIVLLEAWLAGTAGLVHAGGNVLPEHCRLSNGGLWFRNYPEFEEELMLMLENPDLCQRMADRGKAYVMREYSTAVIRERLATALAS